MTRIEPLPSVDRATPETPGAPAPGRRATLSSAVGFTLDFYDLYVALFVAPVIARVFFPNADKALSLAAAFGTLAATLLMRPIGAALLGSLADRRGRRTAMVVALFGVGTVTALTGTLPSHATAGTIAPVLLLLLRLAQGLFVGGVFASTLTIAVESVAPRRRGLVSGLVGGGGTTLGSVLAALALVATSALFPGSAFDAWGWRVMFFAGGLPILLSILVLRYVDESPSFEHSGARLEHPVRTLFTTLYRRRLALNVPVVFGIATHFLLTIGFLPTFLQVVNDLPAATAGKLLIPINLATLLFAPLTGHLSQLYGRRRVMIAVGALNTVALPLLYWLLSGLHGTARLGPIALVSLLLSCCSVAAFGPMPVFLNERFPTIVRASGVALSINIAFALAGLTPTLVNGLSGAVSRIPLFTAGALVLGGVAMLAALAAVPEPDRDLD